MLKNILYPAALLTTTLSILSGMQLIAIAQRTSGNVARSPDYSCYMITQSGQTIDLSGSLCGFQSNIVDTSLAPVNTDDLFLTDYKQAIMKKYPNLYNFLLKQPPELKIGYARAICNGLKAGLAPNEIQTLQNRQIFTMNSSNLVAKPIIVDLELITILAPKYYCQQFNQGS